MTTATFPAGGSTTTAAPKPDPAPAARTCSCSAELECFEKPRFFCGQLLTDVDLEAAVSYVAAKNRLHNRYLFGAGVVCGLAVRCDPCDRGSVILESGYALDCSGNDIVVCSDTPFDVKAFIDRRRKEHQIDCGRNRRAVAGDCGHLATEYCLVIKYEEKPGKPVNALVRDNGCRANRCEPSRTLERFRIELIDKKTAEKLNVRPNLWTRLQECFEKERAKLAAYRREAAQAKTEQERELVYSRMREDLIDFARRTGVSQCDLLEQICDIERMRVTVQDDTGSIGIAGAAATDRGTVLSTSQAITALARLYARVLRDCVCNALLVPCQPCCNDSDYVLLACLEIDAKKNVVGICNTVRTQVITGPALRYWAQPLFDGIGRVIERYCCPEDDIRHAAEARDDDGGIIEQIAAATRVAGAYGSSFVRRAAAATADPNSVRSLTLVNRNVADVRRELEDLKMSVVEARAGTLEEAYRFANLRDFPLEIPSASRVELVTAPDGTVTSVRVLGSIHP